MPDSLLDLASLDLRSALDFAIALEEEALLRYQQLAATVTDPAVAEFFRTMARSEGEHRRQLEARGQVLFRHAPPRFGDGLALDAPAPEELDRRIGVRAAMEAAVRAERRAHDFFAGAIPTIEDPDVRAFFEELRQEEAEHEELLHQRIAALEAAPPVR